MILRVVMLRYWMMLYRLHRLVDKDVSEFYCIARDCINHVDKFLIFYNTMKVYNVQSHEKGIK